MVYVPERAKWITPIAGAIGSNLFTATKQRYRSGRSYTNTNYKRRRSAGRGSSFHSMVVKEMPAKHYAGATATGTTHNTLNTFVPTTGIVQGLTNATRVGDSIQLCALKLNMSFQTPNTSNGYTYRIIVGWTGEEYNFPSSFGSGLGTSEIFLTGTSANWTPAAIVNPKAFTVLYDGNIDVNSQVSGVPDCRTENIRVPLNGKFDYQADGSIQGKTRNLAVVLIGAAVNGVSGTTSTGLVVINYDLIFK